MKKCLMKFQIKPNKISNVGEKAVLHEKERNTGYVKTCFFVLSLVLCFIAVFGTASEGVVQGDINGDDKIGLEEAIYALQVVAGLEAIPPLPHRMKGYQLFSWSEEDEWHFTLIFGTNRLKTFEEIMSGENVTDVLGYAKITVMGSDSIKAVMSKLPAGESLFWLGRSYPWVDGNQDEWPEITHPDIEIIENIKTHCSQLGLELTVYPNPDTPVRDAFPTCRFRNGIKHLSSLDSGLKSDNIHSLIFPGMTVVYLFLEIT
ncbi:MAG: hypothetical protein GY749_28015 [Desulfobacteraceae bacterium]|nr:hypothetical protein [Desulfobacteraceae bacterium]